MTVATIERQRIETTSAAREWYARHRGDVLAQITDAAPTAVVERRSAALLAFAFDDDPSVVARAHAVR